MGERGGEKRNLEKRGKRGSDCNFDWFVLHLHHLSCHSHTFGFHAVTRDVMFGLSKCAPVLLNSEICIILLSFCPPTRGTRLRVGLGDKNIF